MATNEKTSGKAAKTTVKGVRVVARGEQFRRCGRVFGTEPVEIPLADLKPGKSRKGETPEPSELEILRAERQLVVVDVDIEVDAADAGTAAE